MTTKLSADVRSGVARVRAELSDAQQADADAQASLYRVELALVISLAVLALACGAAASRWLVRPLERVSRASREIADGDLNAKVPEAGPRELATLGADVNRMAEALVRRSEELNAYLSRNLEARTRQLRESEGRFRSLVQNAADLITVITADTTVVYQSPSVTPVLGYQAHQVVGARLIDLIHEDDVPAFVAFTRDLMAGSGKRASVAARLRHAESGWRYLEIVGSDRREDRAVAGFVLNMRDITERTELEDALKRQAFHDPLTGLANRARFRDHLEHAILRGARANARLAVLFIDLDNFKSVNDTLGHAAGDELLVKVASVLQSCVREGDTVARLGGDEFAVLLEDLEADETATDIANRIIVHLRTPMVVENAEVPTRGSIGVVLAHCRGAAPDELLRNADIAMYSAKDHGKGRFELYDAGMHASMLERLQLLAELEGALERGEFIIDYQPTVDLQNDTIVGAEALVRWRHPTRGLIAPLDFIPLAEESGVIFGLGRWVMEQACMHAVTWQAVTPEGPLFMMSINVSARQLVQPYFVSEVAEILRRTGVDARGVVLEITESVMMQDTAASARILHELKGLGVKLAIDDFGTGYSSLGYLRQFPFDILKVDKSFIENASERGNDKELERLIIEMGKTLNLAVVAEGIERADQLKRLLELTCEFGQGFYFAYPLPVEEMDALLRSNRRFQRAA
jgi:diguanylate cyclase (GGDEF)-like protein/PAS domain S-box-containing protein